MKQLLLLVMMASFSLATMAQNDPAAKKVLDAVGTKVKAAKGISAACNLVSISSKGKQNGSKSISVLMRGEKYQMKQGKMEVICDGQNVYSFDGDKTITKTSMAESSNSLNPQKLLSGAYDKDFTYKLLPTPGNFYEIEMKPIDTRKNFQKVNLFVDKSKNTISKARILDKSNNVTELKIQNMNFNAAIPENSFVFNKAKYPKDTEILD
ncbi:MAG: outer membrane lipoprotein carrier protein LolA [Bacteroidetes bacterium]|nr:outer membrane lipoprotein carrier protein LolA [Bacteroidota bacterium]